ncbi:MAG TPA: hypothetical protein VFI83_04675 [Gaiella sp.]|nr:hypothetical protein [Gaiella sp.]
METHVHEETARDVVSWRRAQLAQSGFPLPVASGLARDARYDLHGLLELVDRGCKPELAVRILAPLDEEYAA